jgi:hypothetical protein
MLEGSEEYISSPGAIKAGNISSSIRGIASGMNTAFMRHGTSTSRYTFNDHRDSEMYALVDKLLSPY